MTGRWSGQGSRCRIAVLWVLLWPLVSDDGRVAEQARLLAADRAGAAERDLVVVEPVALDQADLRRRYGVAPGRFAALLIGRDGGVKLRSGEPMSTRTLFEAIDAMPMRQAEMRRRGSS